VENPADARARALWKRHAAALASLEARLTLLPAGARRDALEAVLLNLSPNKVALAELTSHFGAAAPRVRYLGGDDADLNGAAGIDGLTVKVFGPPREEAFLKKLHPPRSERWELAPSSGAADALQPFEPRWRSADAEAYWASSSPVAHLGRERQKTLFDAKERARYEKALSDGMDLAFQLENAVNNSSLVLLFRFKGQGLLLPGDAQWGNWQYWIERQLAADVFEQVTLYKAGHHGSHNATPKSVVERLPRDLAVLVPTHHAPFETIPRPELMEALTERSGNRLVRSDEEGRVPKGFRRTALWTDYSVAV
ncbi:MAG: hypothetical protein ACK4N5_26760, partial [Myxococcales bacterium]